MKQPIKRGRFISEINITPFTDVVLVLLIIFMITTPLFVQSGIKINLPKADAVDNEQDKNITITIAPDGKILVSNRELSILELNDEITAKIVNNPDLVVIINADKQVQYNEVITVLDIAKKAGVKRLALGVETKK